MSRARSLIASGILLAVVASGFIGVPAQQSAALSNPTLAIAPQDHVSTPSYKEPSTQTTFSPGFIIADANFYSHDAMSEAEIQAFLDQRIGQCNSDDCLNVLRLNMPSSPEVKSGSTGEVICRALPGGNNLRASTVIYRVQVACGLSARVILVTLQKEQGLITSKNPSNYALAFAMGWACPDTTGCTDPNSWFGYQVYRGARQLVTYKQANFARQPGVHRIAWSPDPDCGGRDVNVVNHATAALYNYTPYQPTWASLNAWPAAVSPYSSCASYGNRNFWFYYNAWFGNPTTVTPNAPTNFRATVNDGAELTVAWTPPAFDGPDPIRDYVLQYRATSASTWRTVTDVGTAASYTFNNPSSNVDFVFRVAARTASATGSFTTMLVTTPDKSPGAPGNFSAPINDGRELTVSWAAPPVIGDGVIFEYTLEYRADYASTWRTVEGVGTRTSHTFANPSPGVSFVFRITARNKYGTSPAATLNVTTPPAGGTASSPSAPMNVAASVNNGEQLTIAWNPPSSGGPVSEYVMEYRATYATTWRTVPGIGTSTSHTFNNPSLGVPFIFRVYARNNAGTSAAATLNVTTPVAQ